MPGITTSVTVDAVALGYWRSLPPLHITMQEAMKLSEYSATNPTGVTIGKRWRRHNGLHDPSFRRLGGKPRWMICEYQDAPPGPVRASDPEGKKAWVWKTVKMCKIVTYRPVIRVKAKSYRIIGRSAEAYAP